jgi:phosphoserine phosphatase RsbU/P
MILSITLSIFLMISIATTLYFRSIYHYSKEDIAKLQEVKEVTEKKTLRTTIKNSRDLEMARKIQSGLLLDNKIQHRNYQITAACYPAEKIGGDFFMMQTHISNTTQETSTQKGVIKLANQRDERINFGIGDVSGHGVASALVMILAKNTMEDLSNNSTSPKQIMQTANKKIMSYTEGSQINFVTAFLAMLDVENNRLIYAKAGHTSPLLFKKNGEVIPLETEGVFLGMFENPEFEEKEIVLEKGDKIFLYTDGLNEAKSPNGDLLGIPKLVAILQREIGLSGQHLFDKILEEINDYTEGQGLNDDATMVLLEVN